MRTDFDTDKYRSGLYEVYKNLLDKYKDKPITLLEIGVYKGGSMLMFEEMLPKATIYGIDILERPECLKDSKTITRVIDQNNTTALRLLAIEAGKFDIIIDDGSHFAKETKNCFDALWQYVKDGGIYIIEDWVAAIKECNSPNVTYASALKGLDTLVFDIASRKTELGIKALKVIVEEDWSSYAIYEK